MQTVRMVVKADADGKLRFDVPAGEAGGEFEVVVVIQPKPPAAGDSPEARGWPPGFIEQTYGSIQDEAFRRYPECEPEEQADVK